MKITTSLLLAGIMAAFCCSMGNAQIIYSNNFALGAPVTISNTPPTTANTYAGGTSTADWNDVLGVNDTNAMLANGIVNTGQGDSWLLPFVPQTNYIYLVSASVTFTNNPGSWVGVGFCVNDSTNVPNGDGRFADSASGGPDGYDFPILTESSGNVQYFGGPKAADTIYSANGAFTPSPGTETIWVILDTRPPLWSFACYVNGVQMGATNASFTANPAIKGVGITQTTQTIDPPAIEWNYFALSTSLLPFVTQQPKSQSVAQGSIYTNVVGVTADPNGGTLHYQWYTNGVPLVNGGAISGVNTNVLIINPVSTNNASTNYYMIVTDTAGAATSSGVSLSVFVTPTITTAFPIPYTNPFTLFGGTNVTGTNYLGSTPTFSVLASGTAPLAYQWLTNGVAVGGATKPGFTLTNCQWSGPTNFSCVVTNSSGKATNAWSAVYVTTPFAPYPQAVLSAQPVAFWRLNEQSGSNCDDYESGNNGIYTNVTLAQTGYNANELTESAAAFGSGGILPSYVGQIQGVDFAATNGANAEFTVEAWANCASGGGTAGGAPVVTKGTYQSNEAFALGVDTNTPTQYYQFYVRSANGTVYTADSSIPAVDFAWHHLVGVCDEANSNVSLYVDGRLAASTYIPPESGNYEDSLPVSIGAGIKSGSTSYNLQFTGYIDDVAAYNSALGSATVAAQYILEAGGLAPVFVWVQTPPVSVTVDSGAALVIPAALIGSAPMGYYWTDVNAGTNVAAGTTNTEQLNTTLTVASVPSSWNGDQLELTVTNAYNSTSVSVSLTVVSGPPTLVTDVLSPFGAPLGGAGSDFVSAVGTAPLSYQWQFNGTNLTDNGQIVGSLSSELTITNAQLADQGGYQVVITNIDGAITSSVASFVIENDQPIVFNDIGPGWTVNNVVNIISLAITNGLLTLTDGHDSEARTFFFDYPVYIGSFQASFTYQDVGGGGADGWAFVVQNDPRGAAAEGGDGGRVGVESGGGDSGTSIEPSWELEFDIYTPSGVGYAMETDGAVGPPWLPTGNLGNLNYAAETNMVASGDPINMTLNYANGVMSMVMTDAVAGVSFSTNVNIGNLPGIVEGETAYVGFTAGDGGVSSVQTITNFTFISLPQPAIQLAGTNALVSWPGSTVGYTLQQNPNLTTTNWVTVTNLPAITNSLNQIVVPAGGSNLFYRLMLP